MRGSTRAGQHARVRSVPCTVSPVCRVLGEGVISELAQKTGLTQTNLLSRLAQVLPGTVDQLTPDGIIAVPEPQRSVM